MQIIIMLRWYHEFPWLSLSIYLSLTIRPY